MITLSGGQYGGYTLKDLDSKIAIAPNKDDSGKDIAVKVTKIDDDTININWCLYDKSLSAPEDTADFSGVA